MAWGYERWTKMVSGGTTDIVYLHGDLSFNDHVPLRSIDARPFGCRVLLVLYGQIAASTLGLESGMLQRM